MKSRDHILLAALLTTFLLARDGVAQVPNLLNYQGRVAVGTGASAVNFNGTGQFKFALVDATGSTTYWLSDPDLSPADGVPDSAVSLVVTKGLYSVLLGRTPTKPIPISVWANADVRLRVWFNDGVNGFQLLAPDQRIAPTGYLSDGSVSSTAIASDAVTSAKIATGAVTTSELAAGAVRAANIAAGAVGSAQIGTGSITAANLAAGAVQTASLAAGAVTPAKLNLQPAGGPPTNSPDGGPGLSLVLYPGSDTPGFLYPPHGFGIEGNTLYSVVPVDNRFVWYGGTNEVMRLTGTGNLRLKVPASGSEIRALSIEVDSFTTPANAQASYFLRAGYSGAFGSPTSEFIVRGDGNVGIGTAAPTQRLHVQDSGAETGRIQVGGTGSNGARKIISFGDNDYVTIGENGTDDLLELTGGIIEFRSVRVGAGPPLQIYSGRLNDVLDTNAVTLEMPGSSKLGIWDDLVVYGETTTTAVNITSDRNAKEEFKPVNAREVLAKVTRLPITEWQYKARDESRPETARHIGPMAQDFREAFARTQRYASVADLQADLTAYQSGFATSAEQAGLTKQLVLLIRRHRGTFSTAAAAWLLLTALGVWFIINLRAKEHRALAGEQTALVERESARRALAASQSSLAEAAFRSADLPAMVQALDSVPPDLRDQRWDYLSAKRDSSLGEFRIEGLGRWRALVSIPGRAAQFAIADDRGAIGIVDVKTRQLLRSIATDLGGDPVLAIAADGSRLAVTRKGAPAIHLYRVADGTLERTVPAPGRDIRRLSLSADGSLLAVFNKAGKKGGMYLVDARDGVVRWKLPGDPLYIVDAIFSPDGSQLFAGLGRELQIIEVATGKVIRSQPVYLTSMALSRDGRRLALGLHSGEVALIDAATGLETQRVRLHLSVISGLTWTAGDQLISVGRQRESNRGRLVMRLWETEGFLARGTFFGIEEGAIGAGWDFDPGSGYLLMGQNPPLLWRIPAGIEAARFSGGNSERGWGTGFISDTMLLARRDFTLAPFDVTNPRAPKELSQSGPRSYLVVAPFWPGGLIALAKRTGPAPHSIKLYRTDGDRLVETLDVPTPERIVQLDWDAAGARILAVELQPGALILDARTGETRLRLPQPIKQAVFAGSGGHVVAIVSRKSEADDVQDDLTLLDAKTGATLASVPFPQRLNALAVSPDRRLVAIGGADMAIRVLDADTLEERFAFRAHDAEVSTLAFHPRLPIVATGSADGSVKIWDYERAHLRRAFLGFTSTPVSLGFSPSGQLLAADGEEKTARLFDLGED